MPEAHTHPPKRGPQLDYDRICAMVEHSFSAEEIALRLGCSERQVRRVAKVRGLDFQPSSIIGTEDERSILWETYYDMGVSPARIAYLFGRSRQAVSAYFSKAKVEGEPGRTTPRRAAYL